MLEIKKHLSKNDFDVWVLYNIMKESISLADYIEVLVCLYAINENILLGKFAINLTILDKKTCYNFTSHCIFLSLTLYP